MAWIDLYKNYTTPFPEQQRTEEIKGKLETELTQLTKKRQESTEKSELNSNEDFVIESIIKREIAALEEVVLPRIKNFYDDEMKTFTQNRKSLTELKEAHDKLKKECFDAVKRSCSYNDLHCIRLYSSFNELDQMLNRSFEFHSENNQRKTDEIMANIIQALITKASSNYIDLMNKKIGEQILSPQQLEKFHKDSYNETSTSLKIELKYVDEDSKPHLKTLEAQLKVNFDSFAGNNLKRTDVIYSEVNKAFLKYLSTAQKNYSEIMEQFFSTAEQSEEILKELHYSFVENLLVDVDRSWKEKMNPADDIKEKVRLVLQQNFQPYWDRFEKNSKIQESADKLVKIIEKDFTRDCDNFITSGAFIKNQIPELIEELLKKSALKIQLSSKDAQQVRQLIRPKIEKCMRRLETLKNFFLEFTNESKKFFQMFKFLNDDKFRMLRDKADKISEKNKLDAAETGIFQHGLEAILKDCKRTNVEIIKNEVATLKEIVQPRITNFYDEEMKKVTQNRKSLPQLKEAHDKLKKECIETVKKSGSYIDFHCSVLQSSFNELDQMLNKALEFHAENNQRKIDTAMVKVNLLGKKAHNNYIELMSRKISEQILSQKQLEQFHRDSYSETSTLLKIELQNLNEDPKPYMKNLESQIKYKFDSFAKDNVKRTETARREKLKLEAMEKKLEKEEEHSHLNNNWKSNAVSAIGKFDSLVKNNLKRTDPAIGIDLGATSSCVAVYHRGKVEVIPNKEGKKTTPSYVTFKDGTVIIGDAAKNQALENPGNTIFDANKMIGRRMDDEKLQNDIKLWPFNVVEENGIPKVEAEGRTYFPEQISAKILQELRVNAEAFLGYPVNKCVITVPAYFTVRQRQATIDAGMLAGLEVLKIIDEPIAAAIAYKLQYMVNYSRNVLIFDMGRVNFDVTILEMRNGEIEVKAIDGCSHLGGEDFDNNLVEHCAFEFQKSVGVDILDGRDSSDLYTRRKCLKAMRRVRNECERGKIYLAAKQSVNIVVDSVESGHDLRVPVTRDEFEKMNRGIFDQTIEIVERVLKSAGKRKTEIDDIVLVGGSTRIPKIQELLTNYFGGKALNKSLNPDEAVAIGAAIQAAILNGEIAKTSKDFKISWI